MALPRRQFLHLVGIAAALPAVSRIAWAQTYPTRPIHWIVSFTAGGPNDTVARIIGQYLSEQLGQQFIIENKVGAGGNIGMVAVLSSPPDGYTIGFVAPNNAINATLYDKLPFDFFRDSAPVAGTMLLTNVMVVHPDVPAKTVAEFIAYAKANPGKINMASSGNGTSPHVAGELFKLMTGVNMVHVPYRGGGPAITDLLAGQVLSYFGTMASAVAQIKAGTLRALAVTAANRLAVLPDVPAMAEVLPGYEASIFVGISAPRGTPVEIITRLNREINAGVADAKIRQRIADLGDLPLAMSVAEFGKLAADESEKWATVIRTANIKAE